MSRPLKLELRERLASGEWRHVLFGTFSLDDDSYRDSPGALQAEEIINWLNHSCSKGYAWDYAE